MANELKETGVVITSLMPAHGHQLFHRTEMDDTKVGQGSKDDPAEVARQGFAALMDGDQTVVAGSLKTKSMAAADKLLPTPSRPSSITRWQNRQQVLAHIGAEIGEAPAWVPT